LVASTVHTATVSTLVTTTVSTLVTATVSTLVTTMVPNLVTATVSTLVTTMVTTTNNLVRIHNWVVLLEVLLLSIAHFITFGDSRLTQKPSFECFEKQRV
jgi:hypothetical protein